MSKYKKHIVFDIYGNPIGSECRQKKIKLIRCEKNQADTIIKKYHYSKKPAPNSFMSFLVYYNEQINGAMQLGYGIRPKKKGTMKPEEVREFDRMWLSDNMPKYSETISLSCLHFYLKKANPEIKYLISYCDTSVGNTGTIYRAANYKLINEIKADFYILENGERVHPVTMWHRHKTRVWKFLQEQYPNIKKANGKQLKFLFDLRSKKQTV